MTSLYKFGEIVKLKDKKYAYCIRNYNSYLTKKLKKEKYIYNLACFNGPYEEWYNVKEKHIHKLHGQNIYENCSK